MSISKDKERMSLVIKKADKEVLEYFAEKDERSLNYIVNQAIREYIENHKEEKLIKM